MTDGPRPVRVDEFDSLMNLVNVVFRSGSDNRPTMGEEYPHLFTPDNFQNLRVIVEDGKVVSHVGTTIRNAVILGCPVRVGNIGAVATYEQYRGRGYAGMCFDDACANALTQGVDFLLISGDRSLYRRADCRRVGLDSDFSVSKAVADANRGQVTAERYTDADLPEVKRLYENVPVRYLRPLEEWQAVLRDGKSTHHKAEVWVLRQGKAITAYAALYPTQKDGAAGIEEFAGDRAALVGGLANLMDQKQLTAVTLHVQPQDHVLHTLLTNCNITPRLAHAGGTQLILNFPQFMHRLRPLIEERVGSEEANRITFREYQGRCVFAYDGETVITTDRGGAAQFTWGTREPQEWQWAIEGKGKEVLQSIFPVPALVYGFSYV